MLCEKADRRLLHSHGFCLAGAAPGVRFLGARLPPDVDCWVEVLRWYRGRALREWRRPFWRQARRQARRRPFSRRRSDC